MTADNILLGLASLAINAGIGIALWSIKNTLQSFKDDLEKVKGVLWNDMARTESVDALSEKVDDLYAKHNQHMLDCAINRQVHSSK